jgi:hypothetical protein
MASEYLSVVVSPDEQQRAILSGMLQRLHDLDSQCPPQHERLALASWKLAIRTLEADYKAMREKMAS